MIPVAEEGFTYSKEDFWLSFKVRELNHNFEFLRSYDRCLTIYLPLYGTLNKIYIIAFLKVFSINSFMMEVPIT